MITQSIGICAHSEESGGISGDFALQVDSSGDSSNEPLMYICPHNLYIVDPYEQRGYYNNKNISLYPFDIDMPWIFNFDEPWKSPNHYPPAPKKLEFKSNIPVFINKNYKQPISRSGFKRGQRG